MISSAWRSFSFRRSFSRPRQATSWAGVGSCFLVDFFDDDKGFFPKLATPSCDDGRVQPLASQQRSDFTRLLTPLSLEGNSTFVLRGKTTTGLFLDNLRIFSQVFSSLLGHGNSPCPQFSKQRESCLTYVGTEGCPGLVLTGWWIKGSVKSGEVRFVTPMSSHQSADTGCPRRSKNDQASRADSLRRCLGISHAILAFLLALVWSETKAVVSSPASLYVWVSSVWRFRSLWLKRLTPAGAGLSMRLSWTSAARWRPSPGELPGEGVPCVGRCSPWASCW